MKSIQKLTLYIIMAVISINIAYAWCWPGYCETASGQCVGAGTEYGNAYCAGVPNVNAWWSYCDSSRSCAQEGNPAIGIPISYCSQANGVWAWRQGQSCRNGQVLNCQDQCSPGSYPQCAESQLKQCTTQPSGCYDWSYINCDCGCDPYTHACVPATTTEGWKCKDTNTKAYQTRCGAWNQESNCQYGCTNGQCNNPPTCQQTDTSCGNYPLCENCNTKDDWYNSGSSYACCDGEYKATCQNQVYKDYSCGYLDSCSYQETSTKTVRSNQQSCVNGCSNGECIPDQEEPIEEPQPPEEPENPQPPEEPIEEDPVEEPVPPQLGDLKERSVQALDSMKEDLRGASTIVDSQTGEKTIDIPDGLESWFNTGSKYDFLTEWLTAQIIEDSESVIDKIIIHSGVFENSYNTEIEPYFNQIKTDIPQIEPNLEPELEQDMLAYLDFVEKDIHGYYASIAAMKDGVHYAQKIQGLVFLVIDQGLESLIGPIGPVLNGKILAFFEGSQDDMLETAMTGTYIDMTTWARYYAANIRNGLQSEGISITIEKNKNFFGDTTRISATNQNNDYLRTENKYELTANIKPNLETQTNCGKYFEENKEFSWFEATSIEPGSTFRFDIETEESIADATDKMKRICSAMECFGTDSPRKLTVTISGNAYTMYGMDGTYALKETPISYSYDISCDDQSSINLFPGYNEQIKIGVNAGEEAEIEVPSSVKIDSASLTINPIGIINSLSLDVGDDGDSEWEYTGSEDTTIEFAEVLQEKIDDCADESCKIPLKFTGEILTLPSTSMQNDDIALSDLDIKYRYGAECTETEEGVTYGKINHTDGCMDSKYLIEYSCGEYGLQKDITECSFGCSNDECSRSMPGGYKQDFVFEENAQWDLANKKLVMGGKPGMGLTESSDFIVRNGKTDTNVAGDLQLEKNGNTWRLFLDEIGVDGELGWYDNCYTHGTCEMGICLEGLSADPDRVGCRECSQTGMIESHTDQDGCTIYDKETFRSYKYGCNSGSSSGGTNGYYRCTGGCICNDPGFTVNACNDDQSRKCYSTGSGGWKYSGTERAVEQDVCGGKKYEQILLDYGFYYDERDMCGARSKSYRKGSLENEYYEEIFPHTTCKLSGTTLVYDLSDGEIQKNYEVYGTPVIYQDNIACYIKHSDWAIETRTGEGMPRRVGTDAKITFDFDSERKCTDGNSFNDENIIYTCDEGRWTTQYCLYGYNSTTGGCNAEPEVPELPKTEPQPTPQPTENNTNATTPGAGHGGGFVNITMDPEEVMEDSNELLTFRVYNDINSTEDVCSVDVRLGDLGIRDRSEPYGWYTANKTIENVKWNTTTNCIAPGGMQSFLIEAIIPEVETTTYDEFTVETNLITAEMTLKINSNLPELTIISPEEGKTYGENKVEIGWESDKEIEHALYLFDRNIADENTTLEDGSHELTIKVWDLENKTTNKTVNFLIDTEDLIINIDSPESKTYNDNEVELKWSANKPIDVAVGVIRDTVIPLMTTIRDETDEEITFIYEEGITNAKQSADKDWDTYAEAGCENNTACVKYIQEEFEIPKKVIAAEYTAKLQKGWFDDKLRCPYVKIGKNYQNLSCRQVGNDTIETDIPLDQLYEMDTVWIRTSLWDLPCLGCQKERFYEGKMVWQIADKPTNQTLNLEDGEYSLEVHAMDYRGRAEYAARTFNIDTLEPEVNNLRIMPENPTVLDDLIVEYGFVNGIEDKSLVFWSVNDEVMTKTESFEEENPFGIGEISTGWSTYGNKSLHIAADETTEYSFMTEENIKALEFDAKIEGTGQAAIYINGDEAWRKPIGEYIETGIPFEQMIGYEAPYNITLKIIETPCIAIPGFSCPAVMPHTDLYIDRVRYIISSRNLSRENFKEGDNITATVFAYDGEQLQYSEKTASATIQPLPIKTNIRKLSVKSQEENETTRFELKDDRKMLIEFITEGLINFSDVEITKQENSTTGYVIIKGLNLTNNTKTVYVDNLLNSTGVCILDKEVMNITEMTEKCDGEDETWIACPSRGEYSCESADGQFKVSGLKHSAVKEYTKTTKTPQSNDSPTGGSSRRSSGSAAPMTKKINAAGEKQADAAISQMKEEAKPEAETIEEGMNGLNLDPIANIMDRPIVKEDRSLIKTIGLAGAICLVMAFIGSITTPDINKRNR